MLSKFTSDKFGSMKIIICFIAQEIFSFTSTEMLFYKLKAWGRKQEILFQNFLHNYQWTNVRIQSDYVKLLQLGSKCYVLNDEREEKNREYYSLTYEGGRIKKVVVSVSNSSGMNNFYFLKKNIAFEE